MVLCVNLMYRTVLLTVPVLPLLPRSCLVTPPPPVLCSLVCGPVRVNMVVSLADLASRFPNVLEPWTAYLYEPLAGEGH